MPDAREYEGNFISAVEELRRCRLRWPTSVVLTTTLHCSSIRGDTLRAIQLSLYANHARLSLYGFSLASWDAEMARSIIRDRTISSSKFQARNFQVQWRFHLISSSRSTSTSLFRDRIHILLFKLLRFKTDCKQSLVEVSTRVKVPSTTISSAYLSCSSNKYFWVGPIRLNVL